MLKFKASQVGGQFLSNLAQWCTLHIVQGSLDEGDV